MQERPNNNPHQEPLAEELTLGEALRLIAERTPFRTEQERDAVYAAIDRAEQEIDDEPEPEPGSESDPSAIPGPSVPGGVAAASADEPTPAPKPVARNSRRK